MGIIIRKTAMNDKCKWLKLVLAASLALNLAFTAPYVYNKFFAKHVKSQQVKETKLKESLSLRPEQKQQLDTIIKSFRLNMMKYKRDMTKRARRPCVERFCPSKSTEPVWRASLLKTDGARRHHGTGRCRRTGNHRLPDQGSRSTGSPAVRSGV